jgi:HSP20 family protein
VLTISQIKKEEQIMFGLTPLNDNYLSRRRSNDITDFHNIIDDFFENSRLSASNFHRNSFKMDIRENDDNYLIDAELPGIDKNEIKIDYENNQLSIAVQREVEKDESKDKYIHRERHFSSMQRSVYLPDIAAEDISASFKDGILEIAAKKKQEDEVSSRIEIK